MAVNRAKVLYDFEGEAGNGELTVYENDVVTIIRQNVGDGWWEAETDNGQRGLVPEAWMEIITAPQSVPATPNFDDEWDDEDEDDDWDDGDSVQQSARHRPRTKGVATTDTSQVKLRRKRDSTQEMDSGVNGSGNNFGLQSANRTRPKTADASGKGTVKKSFANRFSVFAKAGGDAYLLGTQPKTRSLTENPLYHIIDSDEGPIWESTEGFTVDIKNPKKASKLHGMKTYIAYQITPSNTGIQVSRRYKHFDWLYERLSTKFVTIVVPPLPDKQVTGRYEESFIEKRMDQLKRWLDRMTNHAVVGRCDVFMHFLTCTDEKEWKRGKRDAEKDDFLGAAFFNVISVPNTPLDIAVVERQHENFHKFVKSMDASMAQICQVIHDHGKKHIGPFKREYQKIGKAFTELAGSFELDTRPRSQQLTDAIKFTGRTYDEIGELFAAQPKNDNYRLEDFLREYTGMLSCFPDMINFHKHTISTVRECQKQREEQKMEFDEAESIKGRADVVSYTMMAEINHFQRQRVYDYKMMMKDYLVEQIKFYESVTEKLRIALGQYENVNV
ncbi:sorting nexin-33-like isoform X3 [Apostichopus japonicus]|uniref:sorting nexin-33-like isoform X3 n=1 Tax=Stichopus japonicus TaxID=307972 RepID=UPI003AB2DDB2